MIHNARFGADTRRVEKRNIGVTCYSIFLKIVDDISYNFTHLEI